MIPALVRCSFKYLFKVVPEDAIVNSIVPFQYESRLRPRLRLRLRLRLILRLRLRLRLRLSPRLRLNYYLYDI